MRVICHPAAKDGSWWYRFQVPANELRSQGYPVEVREWHKYRALYDASSGTPRVVEVKGKIAADVVVFQRPLRRNLYELMKALQARGLAVVIEVDDDFHSIPPHNAAYHGSNPANDPDHNRDWLMACTNEADWVTVSTPALVARYGRHGRCSVLANYVPASYLDIPKTESQPLRVGWSGSLATHSGDLRVTRGAVARVMETHGVDLYMVGEPGGVAAELGTSEPQTTGWLPLEEWVPAMAGIDIHIVPLKLTAFNEAKSFLKGLQASALGIPFVASPTSPYKELVAMGAGVLAETTDEWEEELSDLITDDKVRHRRGSEAKEVVREHLTIKSHADEWWNAWRMARDMADLRLSIGRHPKNGLASTVDASTA